MNKDYNKIMKEQIKNLPKNKKLLLHVCCAPCTSAVLERVKDFDITLYYYNPNTYPKEEYELRFNQFKFLKNLDINFNTVLADYNHFEFLDLALGLDREIEGGVRCEKCIRLRLEKSFQFAKNNGFNFVTTTLSISPHKNAEFINRCGEELEKIYGVKFLYADFKKENGFLNSIKISKDLNIYRQDYCGCEFSINKKGED